MRCQTPDLPPAPGQTQTAAPASRPSFALPAENYDRPSGAPPDPKKGWICDEPPTGVFLSASTGQDDIKGELRNYERLIQSQLYSDWVNHLRHDANLNAWSKGRIVKVRFVIMKDGTYTRPEITLTSGKSVYDNAAADTIRGRDLFPPPPAGLRKPLAVCMTFTTNTGLPPTPEGWYKSANP
jgi:TonB family protein